MSRASSQAEIQPSTSGEDWGFSVSLDAAAYAAADGNGDILLASADGRDAARQNLDNEDDKTSTSSGIEEHCLSPLSGVGSGDLHLHPGLGPAHDALFTAAQRSLEPSMAPGLKLSPSFQELERAIGASLASTIDYEDCAAASVAVGEPLVAGEHARARLPSINVDFANHEGIVEAKSPPSNSHTPPAKNSGNARDELDAFVNESESRALVLFHPPTVDRAGLRQLCERYGALYYCREEFQHRGVTFLGYFDLRAAIQAYNSLLTDAQLDSKWSIHYSIMLNAPNNTDESRLVVKNIRITTSEADVRDIFMQYGELRSIQRTFTAADMCEFGIEYYNIQDARSAVTELGAAAEHHWGSGVDVSVAYLEQRKQTLMKKLLAHISQWRVDGRYGAHSPPIPATNGYHTQAQAQMRAPSSTIYSTSAPAATGMRSPPPHAAPGGMGVPPHHMMAQPANLRPISPTHPSMHYPGRPATGTSPHLSPTGAIAYHFVVPPPQPTPHIVYQLSPRGNTRHQLNSPPYSDGVAVDVFGSTSPRGVPVHGDWTSPRAPVMVQQRMAPGMTGVTRAHYSRSASHDVADLTMDDRNSRDPNARKNSHGRRARTHSTDADYALDIESVAAGIDKRTTIMIRHIPNKYTQQMLLDEINENHIGTYDFFYLPIDFKNRCNVGYAFINFMDPRSIIAFYQELNGQRWRNFNSEKVCTLTYARIQGKAAMVNRFQNSSLLEKDNEYRPLLFYSNGVDKGKPEPFPLMTRVKLTRKSTDRDRTLSRDSTSSGEREPAFLFRSTDGSYRDRARTSSSYGVFSDRDMDEHHPEEGAF